MASVALRIDKYKTTVMKLKIVSLQIFRYVLLANGHSDEVEFIYLGRVISTTGGTDQDVLDKTEKAR